MKNAETAAAPACPHCSTTFAPRRKNQKYCSQPCQKAASHNTARGPRTVAHSPDLRLRSKKHYDTAKRLAEKIYTAPPNKRLGLMSDLIKLARGGDLKLRNVLTDPKLLRASPDDAGLFFRRAPASYRTISQAADAYCRMFWGEGVRAVVTGQCPEPPTGEVGDTDGHSPTRHDQRRKAPCRPEGWDFRVTLRPICKGFQWLTVGRAKTRELRALGGCFDNPPSAYEVMR